MRMRRGSITVRVVGVFHGRMYSVGLDNVDIERVTNLHVIARSSVYCEISHVNLAVFKDLLFPGVVSIMLVLCIESTVVISIGAWGGVTKNGLNW